MELDFDKEIDTILRNARHDGPVLIGDSSRHLDADEISAFAENAMPEKSRSLYAAHMADCDRCRKILSGVLILNSAAAPAAATSLSAITIAERSIPWYRQLLMFPNLAYVMGGLVLIFGSFLAFTVIQNSREPLTAGVAEQPAAIAPATSEGGPRFEPEELQSLNSNTAANSAANVAAPSSASAATNTTSSAIAGATPGGPRDAENNFAADGVVSTDQTATVTAGPPTTDTTGAAAAPAAQPAKPSEDRDDLAASRKLSELKLEPVTKENAGKDAMLKQQSNTPVQSGPMRNNESQYNRQLENMDARNSRAKAAARAEEEADKKSGGRKLVSGRTFERKDGVWYDSSYQGHPTINVRRGSNEFKRLDAGLRSIANSLSGTIVVVWGSKAYRIQ